MTPDQFSLLASHFPDPALLLAKDGCVLACNRALEALGFSSDTLPQRTLCDLAASPPEQVREYLRLCSRSRDAVPGSLQLRADDGRTIPCRCYGAVLTGGGAPEARLLLRLVPKESSPSQFVALNQKIDELTQEIRRRIIAEERQREQSELLEVTLTSIGDAVITTDANGRVTFLNTVAEDLTGWSQEASQGRPLEEVFRIVNERTRRSAENPVTKVLREGVIVGLANHTILIAKDGAERPIDDSAAPIKSASGRIEGVVLVFRDVTEQKASQQAIREQAEVLRGILAASVDHIYVSNRDGRYRFVSNGAARLLGLKPQDMMGKHWRELGLDPKLMESFDAQCEQVFATGMPTVEEVVFKTPAGDKRHFEYVVTPIQGEDGRPESVVTVSRDVTERRKVEQERFENENRLRLAMQAGRMGTWSWDIHSGAVRWSPQLEEIHGLQPGTFPGTFEAYQRDMHPEDRDHVLASIQRAVRTGAEHHLEYRLVLPDGSIRWVEARGTVFRDKTGNPMQMIGVCVETTARKRTEQDLRFLAEASRSLATLVDYESTLQRIASLAVPNFADWCVIDLPDETGNLRALAIAHADPDKVHLAGQVRARWPPGPDDHRGSYQVFKTGQSMLIEEVNESMLREVAKDDEHFDLINTLGLRSYMCVPLAVRENTIGLISFVSAESGRHYTQDDLVLAEDLARRAAIASENARLYAKLREEGQKKDEFLAMLAHELRNPLAPIRSGLDLLAIMGSNAEILETMQRQVEHLVRLVDDLLDVSRIMRGKIELRREPAELRPIVERAVETVRPLVDKHEQKLTVNLPPEPIWIDADSVRIAQVIGNLLNNASKYTDRGGRIELMVEPVPEQVLIRIRDTGVGIGPDILTQVFDLFTQDHRTIDRSQGGLGIGLTVVKSLVEMHGGSVSVHSDGLGKGSEFTVRLPLINHIAKANNVSALAGASSTLRILVVDDNVPAANMLSMLLKKLGNHEVLTAYDGAAAVTVATESLPQLILLDIGLPKLDGLEVARQLRQLPQFAHVRLVALTGYGTEEDRRNSIDAGFDEHLVKPPGIAALRQLLVQAQSGSQPSSDKNQNRLESGL